MASHEALRPRTKDRNFAEMAIPRQRVDGRVLAVGVTSGCNARSRRPRARPTSAYVVIHPCGLSALSDMLDSQSKKLSAGTLLVAASRCQVLRCKLMQKHCVRLPSGPLRRPFPASAARHPSQGLPPAWVPRYRGRRGSEAPVRRQSPDGPERSHREGRDSDRRVAATGDQRGRGVPSCTPKVAAVTVESPAAAHRAVEQPRRDRRGRAVERCRPRASHTPRERAS